MTKSNCLEMHSGQILALLDAGPMSSNDIAAQLGLNRITLRRWLSLMLDGGDIERVGATTQVKWRRCTGRTMPDESACEPFKHVWKGAGAWQYKPHAKAVASVWQLGAQ